MVELGRHQLQAIQELRPGYILRGGVGTGKSRTSIAWFLHYICGASFPINGAGSYGTVPNGRDLYIITTAKKRDSGDWLGECADFLLTTSRENSYGNIQVTVDSWNNIEAYKDVKDAVFIFDEQRLVGKGAWVKAYLKIAKANQWVILSATPGDNWVDYIPVFIANGFYKNRTDFIDQHIEYNKFTSFPSIKRFHNVGKLDRLRRQITVHMEYTRHTRRIIKQIAVGYSKELYERVWKDRWHVYEERPVREVGELVHVLRKVVNSEYERIEKVFELLKEHPKAIIFYNFNYELDVLRLALTNKKIHFAEWNGQKHEPLPSGENWVYLVQYTAGAEGWNCTTTDTVIFYSLNYSYKILEQSMGRIDRLNTPFTDLFYYMIRSTAQIDLAILKALQTKKNFNEKSFTQSVLL